jgi:hypothetical protein
VQNTIIALVGRKGSGKSTLVGEIVCEHERTVVVDTMNEYGEKLGAEVVLGYDQAVDAVLEASRRRRFRFSLRGLEHDQVLEILEGVATLRELLLVVEEASAYMKAQQIPWEIAQLVRMGRHQGISQLYVAQRPTMLHLDVISQADVIVSFQQHAHRDVETLVGHLGEAAARVRDLERFELIAGGPAGWEEKAPLAVLARLRARNR